jgi:hypothetical protein
VLRRPRVRLRLSAPTFSGRIRRVCGAFTLALGRGITVQGGVGNTFIAGGKITFAFRDLMALGAAPDPALIIALKEIPDHCGTPFDSPAQIDSIAAWPLHTLLLRRAMLPVIIACRRLCFTFSHGV